MPNSIIRPCLLPRKTALSSPPLFNFISYLLYWDSTTAVVVLSSAGSLLKPYQTISTNSSKRDCRTSVGPNHRFDMGDREDEEDRGTADASSDVDPKSESSSRTSFKSFFILN
jgi:hypothetical protein